MWDSKLDNRFEYCACISLTSCLLHDCFGIGPLFTQFKGSINYVNYDTIQSVNRAIARANTALLQDPYYITRIIVLSFVVQDFCLLCRTQMCPVTCCMLHET